MDDFFSPKRVKIEDDILCRSFLGVAAVALVLLTPFCINNFVRGRFLLGVGSGIILAIFAFNAWSVIFRQRYYVLLTQLGLVPAMMTFLAISLLRQGIIGVLWTYPVIVAIYFMLPERRAWLANIVLFAIVCPLAWQTVNSEIATRMISTLGMVSILTAIFVRIINEQQQRLRRQATTDVLTGLLNRALLDDTLANFWAQSDRSKLPMSLIMLDIDFFKVINDTYGHSVGDRVLATLGGILNERLRLSDRAFRIGGEEFLVLLYDTDARQARQVAEALRLSVRSRQMLNKPVTVSMGVATLAAGESWQSWMKRSDEHLYQAKRAGRDRIFDVAQAEEICPCSRENVSTR